MKPGLKRIEATLDQLEVQTSAAGSPTNDRLVDVGHSSSGASNAITSTPSAKTRAKVSIEPFPLPKGATAPTPLVQDTPGSTSDHHSQQRSESVNSGLSSHPPIPPMTIVQPFPTQDRFSDMPDLPPSKSPGVSSHRYAANPNLAIGLLKEIETLVRGWQAELEQIAQQIQAVYEDGPIVDGWLESYSSEGHLPPQPTSASVLRYAEIEHLMELVEQICQAEPAPISEDMRRTSYRLCGLDPDGKLWSRPCPSEQVPYVSLAIARYQKLRTLFAKKQSLENRLTSLVESLTMLHGQIIKS